MQNILYTNYIYEIKPGDNLWLISQRFAVPIHSIIMSNPHLNPNNLYVGQRIHIPGIKKTQMPQKNKYAYTKAEVNLYNTFRLLWEEHVFWTRLAIISTINGLGDEDAVSKRLLKNASDIGAAFEPFYGTEKATKLSNLIRDHLLIAADLVKASKAGDTAKAADAEKRWYSNADEIASYLNSINPYYDKNEWTKMMHEHLAMTKKEAVDILTKNYQASIDDFDNIEKQALMMADSMSKGILQQFPKKFV